MRRCLHEELPLHCSGKIHFSEPMAARAIFGGAAERERGTRHPGGAHSHRPSRIGHRGQVMLVGGVEPSAAPRFNEGILPSVGWTPDPVPPVVARGQPRDASELRHVGLASPSPPDHEFPKHGARISSRLTHPNSPRLIQQGLRLPGSARIVRKCHANHVSLSFGRPPIIFRTRLCTL